MKILLFLSILLLLSSCKEESTTSRSYTSKDPSPLTLIPANFSVVAEVKIEETLKIEGLSDRLIYESKRKPSLQIIPIEKLELLYMAAGSGKDTEEKGAIFICVLKEELKLEDAVKEYTAKFKNNKEVIVGTKKYKGNTVHSLRDKKQEVSACQLGPKTIILGPQDQLIAILRVDDKGISENPLLNKLMKEHQDFPLSVFMLSSDDSGSFMSTFSFFDQLSMSIKKSANGADIKIDSFSDTEKGNISTYSALILARTALMLRFSKFVSANDMKIEKEKNSTHTVATLNNDALKDMFIKD